jgi:nucleoside-diphosphate-sugar epimerase
MERKFSSFSIFLQDKNNTTMQTILGSGGAIGIPLAKELATYTNKVRLVSRHPKKVNEQDELFPADITDPAQVDNAISGSEVVYLTVGFEYNIKVWRKNWPALIRNVIASCKRHNAKLVFFDNIYMIDREYLNDIREDSPVRPTSKKGKVRAEISGLILDEVNQGRIHALIARCADFYGQKNSVLAEMVVKNLMKNKKALWLADANKVHTFTNTLDAAKATALLGNTPDAYNQVWNLPTDRTPRTGKQWVEMIARIMNKEPRYFVIPKWMLSLMGLFVPLFRELSEMVYQYDRDYIFNSSKFEKRFGYSPVDPEKGMSNLISSLQNNI